MSEEKIRTKIRDEIISFCKFAKTVDFDKLITAEALGLNLSALPR